MTAVIRPIGIDHFDFRNGGISALALKIIAAEANIALVHSKTARTDKCVQPRVVKLREALQNLDRIRNPIVRRKRFGKFKRSLSALHGIDHIFFDFGLVRIGKSARQQIQLRRANGRTVALGQNLNALCRGIRPLVELSRQIFHCEHISAVRVDLTAHLIDLRLRKDGFLAGFKQLRADIFHVVAVQNPKPVERRDADKTAKIGKQRRGLVRKLLFLLNVYSVNHDFLLILSRQAPALRYPSDKNRCQILLLQPLHMPHRRLPSKYPPSP